MERNVAILMADLSGYTAMTEVHGGVSAGKIVNQYLVMVQNALSGNAELVQRIGDQVVILSPNACDLAYAARNLMQQAHEQHQFLSIHAGLHFGMIHQEGSSIFGSPVNIASRIMNMAGPGEILCSSVFADGCQHCTNLVFQRVGGFRFKNVMSEVEILELTQDVPTTSAFHMDPVCHMLLDPVKDNLIYRWNGTDYHFCSAQCLEFFRARPQAFVAGDVHVE